VLSKSRIMSDRYWLPPLSIARKLKNPSVTLIRIGNASKQPIVSEDFRGSPIKISFEPSCVLSRKYPNSQNSGISLKWLHLEAPEGSLVDFTGSTARLYARIKFNSADTLFELTTETAASNWATMAQSCQACPRMTRRI
jgi:hypothetical protein